MNSYINFNYVKILQIREIDSGQTQINREENCSDRRKIVETFE